MNGFCHVELPSLDLEKATVFYSSLFGWQMFPIPGGEYVVFNVGDKAVGGGVQKVDKIVNTPKVLNYVEVEDIEACLTKAKGLGAKIVQQKQPLGDASWGYTGILETSDGYRLGLWSKA
jgi:predicted enzyme related to lactoylglutathione lyase